MIEFPRFPPSHAPFVVDDITAIVGVRLGDFNPWILERLELLSTYYHPKPRFLIVDFGTPSPLREQLEECCARNGLDYRYVDDTGTYSNGIARNHGFAFAETELLFFTDADFFLPKNGYARLVELANTVEMTRFSDVMLTMPALHLSESRTAEFMAQRASEDRSRFLERTAFYGAFSARGEDFDFIAAYSNNFLCRRSLFDRLGGYSDTFRGHGSEDFEFFIRYCLMVGHLPRPRLLFSDFYGPLKPSYYRPKPYESFRRLLELMTLPSEMAGLKAFHLYHPTVQTSDWVAKNDWKRAAFEEVTSHYREAKSGLLHVDSLPREKTFLCLVKHAEHWSYFSPLRSAGIRLVPIGSEDAIGEAERKIRAKEVAGYAVFNPYMKSHRAYRGLFDAANESGIEVIVVERGALPSSIYYGKDVSYNDPELLSLDLDSISLNEAQTANAEEYLQRLREGRATLEENDAIDAVASKYQDLRQRAPLLVFVPLQLSDDMAVTQYTDGYIAYLDFVAAIDRVARSNPEITFLVKKHPLSNQAPTFDAPNIVVCDPGDNVHGLIELCNAVACYNSGVGVLALAHEKPVLTVGNAYYLAQGRLGTACSDLDEVAARLTSEAPRPPTHEDVVRFFGWLLHFKYSFFSATDDILDFGTRKAHGYKDIQVEHLNVEGRHFGFETALSSRRFGWDSYAAGHLGISLGGGPASSRPKSTLSRKFHKLLRNPRAFFGDSKNPLFRALGGRTKAND